MATTLLRKYSAVFLLLLLLIVTFLVYLPGLSGDFVFDDFLNIVVNTDAHLKDFSFEALSEVLSSGLASSITRPLSMLSFGLNYYFTQLNPFYFKLTNLVIHLLTGTAIYVLSLELLSIGRSPGHAERRKLQLISVFITACWTLHPLNVSSVLYIVQRMTQLAALAAVCILIFYCSVRRRSNLTNLQIFAALTFLALLIVAGGLFKENAILAVPLILAIEIFLLKFSANDPGQKLFLKLFISLFVIIPGIVAAGIFVMSPETVIGDYSVRPFTMLERLLTEARVLWIYIGWVLMPDTTQFYFYHDNFPVSHSLVEPISTLFAVLGIGLLTAFCWKFRNRFPYLCFGIAFFLIGQAMESTVIALELVFEHRNYLPAFGLLFGGIHTLLNFSNSTFYRNAVKGFLALYAVLLTHGTYAESSKWSNTYSHLMANVALNPDSHRLNYALGYMYLTVASTTPDNSALLQTASHYYRVAADLDDKAVRGHIGVILSDSQNDVTTDPAIIDELEVRLRDNELLENGFQELSQLTECWYSGACVFDKSILVKLYNAIAENKASTPLTVQAILDQLGTAIATIFNNMEDGKALLYLAQKQREELTIIDIKLIQLEIESMNYTQARQLINEVANKPGSDSFAMPLQQMREQLAQAESLEP